MTPRLTQLSAQLCSVAIGGGASATSSGAQKHVRGQVRRILEHFLPRLFGFGQSHGSAQSPLFRFFSHFLSVFVFEYGHQDAPCAHESDTSADMRRQHCAHGRVVFKKVTRSLAWYSKVQGKQTQVRVCGQSGTPWP